MNRRGFTWFEVFVVLFIAVVVLAIACSVARAIEVKPDPPHGPCVGVACSADAGIFVRAWQDGTVERWDRDCGWMPLPEDGDRLPAQAPILRRGMEPKR